jgi:hypothetical protein
MALKVPAVAVPLVAIPCSAGSSPRRPGSTQPPAPKNSTTHPGNLGVVLDVENVINSPQPGILLAQLAEQEEQAVRVSL